MGGRSGAVRAFLARRTEPTMVDATLLLLGTVVVLILAGAIVARQISSL